MPRKLVNWLQAQGARLQGKARPGKQAQDEPTPVVPPWTSRTGDLTPAQSRTEPVATSSEATASSGFFQRLPPEIRRKILIAAIGGRTLHMSLEFGHRRQLVLGPLSPTGRGPTPRVRYLSPTDKYPPRDIFPDPKTPKAWQWRGCACWRFGASLNNDVCLTGVAGCWEHASDVPEMCVIGAFGWLLACRQAYLEGIDVLYSTNTIHMSNWNSVLIPYLGDLLPPHRLAMITSIEVKWTVADLTGPATQIGQKVGRPEFLAMLATIPSAMPNLRSVQIDIDGNLFPGMRLAERALHYDQYLFEPIDNMVRQLGPQLREFILAVPYSVAAKRLWRARQEGAKLERRNMGQDLFWRPLPPLEGKVETDLGQTQEESKDGAHEGGYWVTDGRYDDPYPPMGCFGTGSTDPDLHDAIFKELHS